MSPTVALWLGLIVMYLIASGQARAIMTAIKTVLSGTTKRK